MDYSEAHCILQLAMQGLPPLLYRRYHRADNLGARGKVERRAKTGCAIAAAPMPSRAMLPCKTTEVHDRDTLVESVFPLSYVGMVAEAGHIKWMALIAPEC